MKILRLFIPLVLCLVSFPSFAQQTSAPSIFSITAPVPVPTVNPQTGSPAGLQPGGTSAGAPQFTLTVNGTNFQQNSVVQWTPTATGSTTTALVTTFVSSTKLTAIVPATLVATQGTVNITVLNPILTSLHQVNLQWQPGTPSATASGTASGYAVYRGVTSGGPYTKIQNVTGTAAVDNNVQNGKTYYYVCTAVDINGNESNYSNEARADIPA